MFDDATHFKFDFVCFFIPQHSTRAHEHPGFVLRLILDNSGMKFEPTFKEFEMVILNVYDVMIKASGQVPRVETKLYLDWVRFFLSLLRVMITESLELYVLSAQ